MEASSKGLERRGVYITATHPETAAWMIVRPSRSGLDARFRERASARGDVAAVRETSGLKAGNQAPTGEVARLPRLLSQRNAMILPLSR